VLLAALCEGLRAVTPEREALLQLITHGRPPRFARTGGHFAESLIVRIPLGDGVLDADRLAEVNALVAIAQERAVPSRTLYDRVECFAERKARTYVHCDVMVNYVVRHRPLDEQWSAASGLALETTELVGRRSRTAAPYGGLVLYARMAADSERLTLRLEYEQGLLPQETAAAMGDKFLTALRSLSNKEGRLSAPLLPQPIPES
jgi:non-ribosomal peptide synthetase component F